MSSGESMRILVTGASGLIGAYLVRSLLARGHDVSVVVRSKDQLVSKGFTLKAERIFTWSVGGPFPVEAVDGVEAVIHLAGESIARRPWTVAQKEKIRGSRLRGTRQLVEAFKTLPQKQRPKVLISASAIGYYGDTKEKEVDEYAGPGEGFLSELCDQWETEALRALGLGVRTVVMRMGLILAASGGVLAKMGPAVLGSGQQWMSWIHIDDLIEFIFYSLETPNMSGPYNLVVPQPVRNRDFINVYSKVRFYSIKVGVPAFLLKGLFGEMSQLFLSSQRVVPHRTVQSGFRYQFADLDTAMRIIYKKP